MNNNSKLLEAKKLLYILLRNKAILSNNEKCILHFLLEDEQIQAYLKTNKK